MGAINWISRRKVHTNGAEEEILAGYEKGSHSTGRVLRKVL